MNRYNPHTSYGLATGHDIERSSGLESLTIIPGQTIHAHMRSPQPALS